MKREGVVINVKKYQNEVGKKICITIYNWSPRGECCVVITGVNRAFIRFVICSVYKAPKMISHLIQSSSTIFSNKNK